MPGDVWRRLIPANKNATSDPSRDKKERHRISQLRCLSSMIEEWLEDDLCHQLHVEGFARTNTRSAIEVTDGIANQAKPAIKRA